MNIPDHIKHIKFNNIKGEYFFKISNLFKNHFVVEDDLDDQKEFINKYKYYYIRYDCEMKTLSYSGMEYYPDFLFKKFILDIDIKEWLKEYYPDELIKIEANELGL